MTIASIIRVTSVQNSLKNKDDLTFNFIPRGIWTLVEANLGIICSCLPVLKKPLGRMFPRLFGSTKNSSAYYLDNPRQGRGYNLSHLSNPDSTPEMWRGQGKSRQTTSVSGPAKPDPGRKSDEQYIFTADSTKGSVGGRDSDGETTGPCKTGGISKRVDLVRTSFHEEPKPVV